MRKLFLLILLFILSISLSSATINVTESNNLTKLDKFSKPNSYIIELKEKPVLEAIQTEKISRSIQSLSNSYIKNKVQKVKKNQEKFLNKLGKKVGPPVRKGKRFQVVYNGLTINNVSNKTLKKIKEMDSVEEVHRNYIRHIQLEDEKPLIGADKAHNTKINGNNLTGKGVTVAVLDTGIDYTHKQLGGCTFSEVNNSDFTDCRFLPGYDFYSEEYDYMDERTHGTHVTGILGANGPAMEGVAPKAKIRGYRVCGPNGCYLSDMLGGIERAMDPNNDGDPSDHVDILQMSIGGPGYPSDTDSEAINNAFDTGVVPVISAGNDGEGEETIASPGAAENALTVGSVDDYERLNHFSSRGPEKMLDSTNILFKPEISAPGYEVNSTVPGGFSKKSGTSMASPMVSGATAIVLQKYPGLKPRQVEALMIQTSQKVSKDVNNDKETLLNTGAGTVNISEAIKTSTVVTPSTISFGLSNSTTNWWNETKTINVTNFGSNKKNYSLKIGSTASGTSLEANKTQFKLSAGETIKIQINLSVNKTKLDNGEYPGIINVKSNTSETLRVPYLYVDQDFKLEVKPKENKDGEFRFHLITPIEYSKNDKKIYIKKPDGSRTTKNLSKKYLTNEIDPDNQDWYKDITFSQDGIYKVTVNSSLLPGKELVRKIHVNQDKPQINIEGRFPEKSRLKLNVSSPSDLGRSIGRNIPLVGNYMFKPVTTSYNNSLHIFWDSGGYYTDITYSVFENGKVDKKTELQLQNSQQAKDVTVSKFKNKKALASWYSNFASYLDCTDYCIKASSAIVNLETGKIEARQNVTQYINNLDIHQIKSAKENNTIGVTWFDDRANLSRDLWENKDQTVRLKLFDTEKEKYFKALNVSENIQGALYEVSIKSMGRGFDIYWSVSKPSTSKQKETLYNSKYYLNGTLTTPRNVTKSREDLSFECETIKNHSVCFYGYKKSSNTYKLNMVKTNNGITKKQVTTITYSDSFQIDSNNQKAYLSYYWESTSNNDKEFRIRTYNGTLSKPETIYKNSLGSVPKPEPTQTGYTLASTKGGAKIWIFNNVYVALESPVLMDKQKIGTTFQNISDYNIPITSSFIKSNNQYHYVFTESKAHTGYYSFSKFSSPRTYVRRVSKKPETKVILPNGEKKLKTMKKKSSKWQINFTTKQGGTHIIQVNATGPNFKTGSNKTFFTRNTSTGSNKPPGKPDWKALNNTITEDTTPLLNWTESKDPDNSDLNYIVLLDDNESVSTPEIIKNLEKTNYTPSYLGKGNYSFKVYATDHKQDGKPVKGSFTVDINPSFKLTNDTKLNENITIESDDYGTVNITRTTGNTSWYYIRKLDKNSSNYTAKIPLRRYGFYNITYQERNRKGEIAAEKTKKIFVNSTKPVMESFTIMPDTPASGDKITIISDFKTKTKVENISITISNSTWSKNLSTKLEVLKKQYKDSITGQKYFKYLDPEITAEKILSESKYNVTAYVENLAGSEKAKHSFQVLEKINITVKLNQENPEKRSIAILKEKKSSSLKIKTFTNQSNITVPNVTQINKSFSIAVIANNLTRYQSKNNSYIWDIKTTIKKNVTINVSDTQKDKTLDNKILYSRFSSIYSSQNKSNTSKISVVRQKSRMKNQAQDYNQLTIYNCKNYSQKQGKCNENWRKPSKITEYTSGKLQFVGVVNMSEALALGEPVKDCYPDCSTNNQNTDGGFSGGATTQTQKEKVEITVNNSNIEIKNLEKGPANLNTSKHIFNRFQLVKPSQNTEYQVNIQEEKPKDFEEEIEYKSYNINVLKNGEEAERIENGLKTGFHVQRSWLNQNNLSKTSVKIKYKHDKWIEKPVKLEKEKPEKFYYTTILKNFSKIQVTAEKPEKPNVTARAPTSTKCIEYDSKKQVPENWIQVENCEKVKEKAQEAQILIRRLPEDKTIQNKVQLAYQKGNFTKAINIAENYLTQQRKDEKSKETSLTLVLAVFIILILLASATYFGYRKYRERKLLSELAELTTIIREEMSKGNIKRDESLLNQIEQARQKAKNGEYEEASNSLEKINRQLRKKEENQ